jgi:hypothetical protein
MATDRLTLARAFSASEMQQEAAENVATAIFDAIHDNVATKDDLRAAVGALSSRIDQVEHKLELVEHRLMTRLGGLAAVLAGLIVAALHYWPPRAWVNDNLFR